jgi:hypothetical protein
VYNVNLTWKNEASEKQSLRKRQVKKKAPAEAALLNLDRGAPVYLEREFGNYP